MVRRGFVLFVMAGSVVAGGCGPSLYPVSGVVKLDGVAVAGANVTFVSQDGSQTFTAPTDADGKFTLTTGEKQGVVAGTYKVLVVKYPTVAGGEDLKPSDPEYVKQMERNKKDADKAAKAASTPSGPPGGGMRPPPGMMPGGKSAPPLKSELPSTYASASTTPFSITVPLQTSPVAIDLKKDAAKK